MADKDTPQEVAHKFIEKLKSSPFVMIGLTDGAHSEPMTAQIDDDQPNVLFFFAGRDNRIAKGGDAMAQFVGNRSGSDGTEQLAVLASFDVDDERELAQRRGELGHGIEFLRFAFGAALLERFDLALVRASERNRQPLREQIIARVTRGYFHMVRFGPKTDYIVSQNNFSFWHFSLL